MPNNKYVKGANFERWLLTRLRELGYDGVRSAGSHTCTDLIVWNLEFPWNKGLNLEAGGFYKPLEIYAIQCKTTNEKDVNLTDLIWQDSIRELTAMPDNFTKVLCIKQPRKITQLVFQQKVHDGYYWEIKDIFKLK